MSDWLQPDDFGHDHSGYETPEEAIAGDIPSQYWKKLFIDIDPSGRYAVAVLGLNDPPFLEFEQGFCDRFAGRWYEQGDMTWYPPLGLFLSWDQAPPDAVAARVRFQGKVYDCQVSEGYWWFVTWELDEQRYEARSEELNWLRLKQAESEVVDGVVTGIILHPERLTAEEAKFWNEASTDRFPEVVELVYP